MHHNHVCLEWKNLEYTVARESQYKISKFWKRPKTEYLNILQNVNGCLNTGEMVAVLGPSGAGKTTFLASISQRMRGCDVKGSIYLNGSPVSRKEITKISSYLPQSEMAVEYLTCHEHLYFMCWFKMDRKSTKAEKNEKVDELLLQVGLKDKAKTMITNLSGGEKKRLSLAEELIGDPHFIFCDEPTTGLDSFSAYSVIKTLRELTTPPARATTPLTDNMEMQILPTNKGSLDIFANNFSKGRIRKGVICTIHQPTSDIFELFTHIVLISSGNVVYQGDIDDAALFFSRLGLMCPRDCSPAEFYVKLISDENSQFNFRDIIKYNYGQEVRTRCCKPRLFSDSTDYQNEGNNKIRRISCITQLYILLLRLWIQTRRNFRECIMQLGFLMITSSILSLLYSGITDFDQSSIQNIQGSLVVATTEVIFFFSYSSIYIFPSQLPAMRREVGEDIFTLAAFYLSQVIRFVPKAFLNCYIFLGLIYTSINYFTGLQMYLSMGLTLTITAITASAYGFLISSIFVTVSVCLEAAPIFDAFLIMFGGLYFNLHSVPILKYFSVFYFANEALAYEYWHDIEAIGCKQIEGYSCLKNGTAVLDNFGFETHPYTIYYDYAGLAILFFILHIFSFYFTSRFINKAGYY